MALNEADKKFVEEQLALRVQQPNGQLEQVISMGPNNVYGCLLCSVPYLPAVTILRSHVNGKKHQSTINGRKVVKMDEASAKKAAPEPKETCDGNEIPAELNQTAQLLTTLSRNHDEPFVGLEYIIELIDGTSDPAYYCLLCDKRCDSRAILIHFSSFSHRKIFLDKHYPSLMAILKKYEDPGYKVAIIKIVEEVCLAVEAHHGRLKPLVAKWAQYVKKTPYYTAIINKGKHFSELNGPSFSHLVTEKKIEDMMHNIRMKSDNRRSDANVEAARDNSARLSRRRSRSISPIFRRSRNRSRSRSRSRGRSPRRQQIRSDSDRSTRFSQRSRSPADHVERERPKNRADVSLKEVAKKWDKYRTMTDKAVKELDDKYVEYEKQPETHPMYPDEWKKFWNRRYKELKAEDKDPNTYDFKPEWVEFWIQRMKALYNEDAEAKKGEIRKQLELSVGGDNRGEGGSTVTRTTRDMVKDDKNNESRSKRRDDTRSRSRSPKRRRSRSDSRSSPGVRSSRRYRSPTSRSPSYDSRFPSHRAPMRTMPANGTGMPHYYGGYEYDYYYHHQATPVSVKMEADADKDDDDEPLCIVAVLRILTALEEQLGSLGPRTLELLAKALALEKVKANSSDDILLNDENAVFFETIKEKLKGQLIAGVVERHKINAVKKAIRKVAAILHEISKKESEDKGADGSNMKSEGKQSTVVINVSMDKAVIAQKIAAALVAEKKVDILPEQLEVLINVFFEMLKKSKELNRVITTCEYIELTERARVADVAKSVNIFGPVDKPVYAEKAEDMPGGSNEFDEGAVGSPGTAFTDSDLRTLLQNFKDLSSDEQQHLISHLKKLEAENPERVDRLRKLVNFDDMLDDSKMPEEREAVKFRLGSKKKEDLLPTRHVLEVDDDDDDDDYNFDDVVKAASRNLNEKESEDKVADEGAGSSSGQSVREIRRRNESPETEKISETHSLIANIMGSLQKNASGKGTASAPSSSSKKDTSKGSGNAKPAGSMGNLPFYQQKGAAPSGQPNAAANTGQVAGYNQAMAYGQQSQMGYNMYPQQQQVQYGGYNQQQNYGQWQQQQGMPMGDQQQYNYYGNYDPNQYGQQPQHPQQYQYPNNGQYNYY